MPLYYYQYFCLYRRNTHTRRDIKLVFLFKGNTHANVSLNKFDALVFKWIVAMENWKLGYKMWVNDRVARHPVVLIALKRERCRYINFQFDFPLFLCRPKLSYGILLK